ncbi:hypothetical protein [Halofilum ochraceum]|uniref:hypothetical protein n=1 Tax=Halofilum ochraceum TaxID=1611323 RepID=UPI000833389A|nr:hypothetical protein [Halofilum ochraceum]
MQSLLVEQKRKRQGRHTRGLTAALLALLFVLTAPATAWSADAQQIAATVAAGDAGLPAATLDDRALAGIRARNAEGNTPVGGNQRTGVTLWDERGSPTQSTRRRNHSDGAGNRQTHTLQLGH